MKAAGAFRMRLPWLALCLAAPVAARASDYDAELARIGRELAACLGTAGAKRVATYDFTDLQLRSSELGRLVAEELTTELVLQAGGAGFAVVDRNHLQAIVRDHELRATGLTDPETAKQLGKFAGIDTLITGNVVELESTIRLTVKAMDTETATIRCASRGDVPKTMALREIAGSALRDDAPPSKEVALARSPMPLLSHEDALVRVSLKSASKSKDGSRVELVLGITSQSQEALYLALDETSPPLLTDNLASTWNFMRAGGIGSSHPQFKCPARGYGIERYCCCYPTSTFARGVEHVVTFTFTGVDSAATELALSSSLVYSTADPNAYTFSDQPAMKGGGTIPVGLSGIRLR